MADLLTTSPTASQDSPTTPALSIFNDGSRFINPLGFLDPMKVFAFDGSVLQHQQQVTVTTAQSGNNGSSGLQQQQSRNSTKTLKCPKCNWHYKYQEALENHLKDKHPDVEITCVYCIQNLPHPKLARGETYSCGYKPFRCSICNYSTTTKGNLSIHMQSDKHLHAVQEMPANIGLGFNPSSGVPSVDPSDDKPFHCLVCGTFTTASLNELFDHLNVDRSTTSPADVTAHGGTFQCFLCPYNTNLKANFQLHMRTDKHVQRVQLANHMRESSLMPTTSTGAPPSNALLCRLANFKNVVQVRCRPCHDVLASNEAIQDHCQSANHLARVKFASSVPVTKSAAASVATTPLSAAAAVVFGFHPHASSRDREDRSSEDFSSSGASAMDLTMSDNGVEAATHESHYRCKKCDFSTDSENRAIQHLPFHEMSDSKNSLDADSLLDNNDDTGDSISITAQTRISSTHSIPEDSEEIALLCEMGDARLACRRCNEDTNDAAGGGPGAGFMAVSLEEFERHIADHSASASASADDSGTQNGGSDQLQHMDTSSEEVATVPSADVSSEDKSDPTGRLDTSTSESEPTEAEETDQLLKCNLCEEVTDAKDLAGHFVDEHKLTTDVAKKFALAVTSPAEEGPCGHVHQPSPVYRYHCPMCPMVFRTPESLQRHGIRHLFEASHKCSRCARAFKSFNTLKNHLATKHGIMDADVNDGNHCSICRETFPDRQALQTHVYSIDHLHKAKKFLESQSQGRMGRQLNDQVMSMLSAIPKKQTDLKPYKCNVCRLSYGQGSTLDIHLRSVAHQNRMGRLAELLAAGEVEACLPVSEQPGGIPQKTIGELVLPATNSEIERLKNSSESTTTTAMDVASSAAAAAISAIRKRKCEPADAASSPLSAVLQMAASGQLPFFNAFNPENAENGMPPDLSGVLQSLLNRQPLSSREPSPLNSNGPGTANSPTPDEEAIVADEPRTGKSLWVTLEDFGIDLVQQFFKDIRSKRAQIERLDDAVLAELLRVNCPNCNLDFGSIWLLRAHAASAHGTASIPLEAVQQFSEKLKRAIEDNDEVVNDAPELKRIKLEEITSSLRGTRAPHLMSGLAPTTQASHKSSRPSSTVSSAATTPAFDASNAAAAAMMQMAMSGGFGMMNPLLGMMNPELMFSGGLHGGGVNPPSSTSQGMPNAADIAAALGQQRRARTKITDDQLRVLKTYFDINNSPSEAQVKEMSQKTGLAEKVIKHWFRNTLFKERQRDKDSPYNFNIPPQMSIDLDTYEKTGEAKILPVKTESFEASSNTQSASTSPRSTSDCLAGSSAVVPGPEKLLEKSVSPQPVQATVKAEPVEAPTPQANTPAPELANEFLATLKALNNNLMNNPFAFFNQGVAGFGGGDPAAAMAAAAAANPLAAMFSSMGGGGGSTPSGLENLGSTMSASNNNNNNNNNQQMPVSSGSGRRANRTRFTDVQLRTLQQFFDKQAYPKDDDLEMLSKKLNLSPRVIVVWFQNARQKARKIYENTPNLDNNERFVRTPGQNFQCKRCSIVFPRYYELIQHQQKVCYVNDNDAQQTDNKSVDGSLSDEEKPTTSYDMAPGAVTSASSLTPPNYGGHGENSSSTSNAMETLAQLFASNSGAAGQSVQLPTTSEELLKFLTAPNTNCTVQPNETLSKMLENQQMGHSSFCKRCPLCGSAFHQRHALIDHLASRHPDRAGNIDVDSLPEAELSTSMSENPPPLDLSSSVTTSPPNEYNGHNRRDSTPSFFDTDFDLSSVMTVSPGLLASSLFANSAPGSMCSSGSPQPGALNGGMSNNGSSSSASASAAAAAAAAKRYRTHLTPQQVYVMKALFNDYKTPSMTECDMLGREIGLNKRVVQVWFQNARAKERKCRSVTGDEDLPKTDPDHCLMCGVNFLDTPRGKVTMQDHIFTGGHISKLSDRFNIRNVGENKRSSSSGVEDMLSNGKSVSPGFGATDLSSRQRARAVRDSGIRKPQSVSNEALVGGYPYNMMCIPNGASLPMYDAAVIGVPIAALQIPPAVMAQISSDLAAGKEFTKFTQDGLSLADLRNKISEDDFACARAVTSEVGCACPGCSHTFQQSVSLDTHQKLFCSSVEGKSFKLLQIHYECSVCHVRMGTQDEFKKHIEALTHVEARFRNPPQFSVPNLAAVSQ